MIDNNKPLVFVVEDNNAYGILISRILQKNGFKVMLFQSGKEAANMLSFTKPDLILSDIEMPVMDGFEFNEHVRKNFSEYKIPFIYLSSTTCSNTINKAKKLGATGMLDKPVSPNKLKEAIDEVLSLVS